MEVMGGRSNTRKSGKAVGKYLVIFLHSLSVVVYDLQYSERAARGGHNSTSKVFGPNDRRDPSVSPELLSSLTMFSGDKRGREVEFKLIQTR